jgi:peptide deformylase
MAVLEIVRMGHPVLRDIARPVSMEEIQSKALATLVQDMTETLYASGGIGLAAPQVNHSIQLAIIEIGEDAGRYGDQPAIPLTVYINPTITVLAAEEAGFWEGCLSVPGLRGYVERPQHIQVDYLDMQGEPQQIVLQGFLATVFQHEFDHLLGKLYVDRMKDFRLFSFEEELAEFQTAQS